MIKSYGCFEDPQCFSLHEGQIFEESNYSCTAPEEKRTQFVNAAKYEGWNFNSGNYLFTIDTK